MSELQGQEKYLPYMLEIFSRSHLQPSDLAGLCADIPGEEYTTAEKVFFNNFYGAAEQIKRFLNLPSSYPLKAALQHGNQYGETFWDAEIHNPLPVSLAWGEQRAAVWKKHTEKPLCTIGAPFFYTKSLFSVDVIARERARLGKNLLVFPTHSTHHITTSFDTETWLEKIRENSKYFSTVRICIYWKDYLLGRHKPYVEAGYECVSAGHMYDLNFLPRLRFLLEVCDATMSNQLSSHVGYSLFLGKPHKLFQQELAFSVEYDERNVRAGFLAYLQDPGVQKILASFSTTEFHITPEQLAVLDPYFGFSALKSPSELFAILRMAEDLYQKAHPSSPQQKSEISLGLTMVARALVRPLWRCLPRKLQEFLRCRILNPLLRK